MAPPVQETGIFGFGLLDRAARQLQASGWRAQ
jgi:hypothetical protein